MKNAKFSPVFAALFASPFFLTSLDVFACDCTKASLYGRQIEIHEHDVKQTVTVGDSIELISNNSLKSDPKRPLYDIDIDHSSIVIHFKKGSSSHQTPDNKSLTLQLKNLAPQLADSGCTAKVSGMYIQSNNPKATSLNANASFSDDAIKLALIDDNEIGNGLEKWSDQHWVKVNLLFQCSQTLPPPSRNGMTWGFRSQSIPSGPADIVQVGCNSSTEWASSQGMCDPYKGETSCSALRPILCVQEHGEIPRPAYAVIPDKENFSGWFPGKLKLSNLVTGEQLTSLEAANELCGEGWRMAEFHDGHWIKGMDEQTHHVASNPPWNLNNANTSGGWNFHGQFQGTNESQHQLKTQRFWVHIKNQAANCWDPTNLPK